MCIGTACLDRVAAPLQRAHWLQACLRCSLLPSGVSWCSNAVVDAADAQGAQARLRSKQLLLDMLVERIRCASDDALICRLVEC